MGNMRNELLKPSPITQNSDGMCNKNGGVAYIGMLAVSLRKPPIRQFFT